MARQKKSDIGFPAFNVRNALNGKFKNRRIGYIQSWQKESDTYNNRIGIRAYVPDWITEIDCDACCPKFSSIELETISRIILKHKIIPVLGYAPKRFFSIVKQVWWIVPFCIWREDSASWVMIDKNGLYCAHPDDNDMSGMMSWENVQSIDFEPEYSGDANVNMLTIQLGGGSYLTISEFVSKDQGSYLSVVNSIWQVRKKTIEKSRGLSTWKEGSGGEGFKYFSTPNALLDKKVWLENPSRPDPRFFG